MFESCLRNHRSTKQVVAQRASSIFLFYRALVLFKQWVEDVQNTKNNRFSCYIRDFYLNLQLKGLELPLKGHGPKQTRIPQLNYDKPRNNTN